MCLVSVQHLALLIAIGVLKLVPLNVVHENCLEYVRLHAFPPCHCVLQVLKLRMQFGTGQTKNVAYINSKGYLIVQLLGFLVGELASR